MNKVAYQKLIDEAVCKLKYCLEICTQLLGVQQSDTPLEIGDYVLVKTPNGCILKPYTTIGLENLTYHTNFSALNVDRPQPVAADTIVAVRNSQGTQWLPGNLGGTYYPKGYYISTGVAWEFFGEFAYQASLADVDAGIIADQFVSPFTFENAAKWNTKNDSIQFKDHGVDLGLPGTVKSINVTGSGGTMSRIGDDVTINISSSGGYLVHNIAFADSPYSDVSTSGNHLSICDATLGNIVYLMPPALGNDSTITITKKDYLANTIDVTGVGGDTIMGVAVKKIHFTGTAITLKSDKVSNWYAT